MTIILIHYHKLLLSNTADVCGPNFKIVNNGNCYHHGKNKKSYPKAAADCRKRGGKLVSVHSADENAFIRGKSKVSYHFHYNDDNI